MKEVRRTVLDPVRVTDDIRSQYLSYVTTALPVRFGGLMDDLRQELARPDCFVKGPYLEATPPFVQHSEAYDELIGRGFLCASWRGALGPDFPAGRRPYRHQFLAYQQVIERERNLIVATGTGSGKTESFLVPIIDHLLRQGERGCLTPGVRALLLYPMNALANDQLKRLRELLHHLPQITFGRYTGDTRRTRAEAERQYHDEHVNAARFRRPLDNELLSRDEMHQRPPHILLTNYAMLEYLLLRPNASPLFEHGQWRFIVLDEAHTYDGARGIEVAMLLRRLKDRVVLSEPGRLRCVATSATMGTEPNAAAKIAAFAREVFCEDFDATDVVMGERGALSGPPGPQWTLPASAFIAIAQHTLDDGADVMALAKHAVASGAPDTLAAEAAQAAQRLAVADGEDDAHERVGCFLHHLLRQESTLCQLRAVLDAKHVQSIEQARASLFAHLPDGEARDALVGLVGLAARARPSAAEASLLPARYHVFARALEGGYVRLYREPRLHLSPCTREDVDGRSVPVFEAAVCTNCGALFIVGKTEGNTIVQSPLMAADHIGEKVDIFWVTGEETRQPGSDDEDEDLEGEEGADPTVTPGQLLLCTACGEVRPKTGATPLLCTCGAEGELVSLIRATATDDMVRKCPACQKTAQRRSIISRFTLGRDAPVAVLASALYTHLPEKAVAGRERDRELKARQFISFADSRQDAAFFAPYLERTYGRIVWRRLICQALMLSADLARDGEWILDDFRPVLQRYAEELGVLDPKRRPQERLDETWRRLLLECLRFDRHNDLEATGCVAYRLRRPAQWTAPPALNTAPWELSDDEVWTLYEILLDSIRAHGAMAFPETPVRPDDECFAPRNREIFLVYEAGGASRAAVKWLPSAGRTNGRIGVMKAVVGTQEVSQEQTEAALLAVWEDLTNPRCGVLRTRGVQNGVARYQLDRERLLIATTQIGNARWYQCATCKQLTPHPLRGRCFSVNCGGRIEECDPSDLLGNSHYGRQYVTPHEVTPMAPMSVREHTAQLSNERAAQIATDFIAGDINVLSCSTTFELGVDIGELQSVLLRNMPPKPANYVQRAGRAGRRLDSVGFALTFAQRRTHDLYYFQDPERIVNGQMRAPRVRVANEKIIKRHMNAVALAAFWREHPEHFHATEDGKEYACALFGRGDDAVGVHCFEDFMEARPQHVKDALKRIVPDFPIREGLTFHQLAGVDDWGQWVSDLLADDGTETPGVLTKAVDGYEAELRGIEEALQRLEEEKPKGWQRRHEHLERVRTTIQRRRLIGYLASRGVLPKYGFPVDVVPLQINYSNPPSGGTATEDPVELDLDRDLRIALAEYSPGCQIVAGGSVWTSRGIHRPIDRHWVQREWRLCEGCGRYYSRPHIDSQHDTAWGDCSVCHHALGRGPRRGGVFVVPEFGFNTHDEQPRRPTDRRPRRGRITEVHFSGKEQAVAQGEPRSLRLAAGTIEAAAWRDADLAVITRDEFLVCRSCGYAVQSRQRPPAKHNAPWGRECPGHIQRQACALGYEFKTDICQIAFSGFRFPGANPTETFWPSLLYALVEGCAVALDISRDDIGGVLFREATSDSIIVYDDVPGGAGHAWRILNEDGALEQVFLQARDRVSGQCGCAPETTCYGCLRTFTNQRYHDQLSRGEALGFLDEQVVPAL